MVGVARRGHQAGAFGGAVEHGLFPAGVLRQKAAALLEALLVGIDGAHRVERRARHAHEVLMDAQATLADDEEAVAAQQVVYRVIAPVEEFSIGSTP